MAEKQYTDLPTHFMLVQKSFRDEVYLYTADQMRAYVDADRAMRALQAAPAAWRHSRTYSVYEAAEQVPIADGDEWAEPLYLHPPEAQATSPAVMEPFTAAQRERMFRNRPSDVGKGLSLADWHRVVQYVEACHGIGIKRENGNG